MAFSQITATLNPHLRTQVDIHGLLTKLESELGVKPNFRKGKYIIDCDFSTLTECEAVISRFILDSTANDSSSDEDTGSNSTFKASRHGHSPPSPVPYDAPDRTGQYRYNPAVSSGQYQMDPPQSSGQYQYSQSMSPRRNQYEDHAGATSLSNGRDDEMGRSVRVDYARQRSIQSESSDSMPALEQVPESERVALRARAQYTDFSDEHPYDMHTMDEELPQGTPTRSSYMTTSAEKTAQDVQREDQDIEQKWYRETSVEGGKKSDFKSSKPGDDSFDVAATSYTKTTYDLGTSQRPDDDATSENDDFDIPSSVNDTSTHRRQTKRIETSATFTEDMYVDVDVWEYISAVFIDDLVGLEDAFGISYDTKTAGENLEFHHVVVRGTAKGNLIDGVNAVQTMCNKLSKECYRNMTSVSEEIPSPIKDDCLKKIRSRYPNLLIKQSKEEKDQILVIGERTSTETALAEFKKLLLVPQMKYGVRSAGSRRPTHRQKEKTTFMEERAPDLLKRKSRDTVFRPSRKDGDDLVKQRPEPRPRTKAKGSDKSREWEPTVAFSDPKPLRRQDSDPFGEVHEQQEATEVTDILDEQKTAAAQAPQFEDTGDKEKGMQRSREDDLDMSVKSSQKDGSKNEVSNEMPAEAPTKKQTSNTDTDLRPDAEQSEPTNALDVPENPEELSPYRRSLLEDALKEQNAMHNFQLTENDYVSDVRTENSHTKNDETAALPAAEAMPNEEEDIQRAINMSLKKTEQTNEQRFDFDMPVQNDVDDSDLEKALQESMRVYQEEQRTRESLSVFTNLENQEEFGSFATAQEHITEQRPYAERRRQDIKSTHVAAYSNFDSDEEYAQSLKTSFRKKKKVPTATLR